MSYIKRLLDERTYPKEEDTMSRKLTKSGREKKIKAIERRLEVIRLELEALDAYEKSKAASK